MKLSAVSTPGVKSALAALFLGVTPLFTGCVSAKYKSAARETPPTPLNLTNEQAPMLVTVKSVIVYRGPGSWKRDAYWDEYIVSLVNHGRTPVTLESASLFDFTGTANASSDSPWVLEKQSRTREEELKANIKDVVIQVGGGYATLTAAVMGATEVGGFLGGIVAVPAFVAGTIYSNVHHRHIIENEFARRRIVLPATIAPGQAVQGSLFFRISPGPRHLAFLVQYEGAYQKVVIDLAPLAGLHLRAKT